MHNSKYIDLIGNTPMIALPNDQSRVTLLAKCEFFNPGMSLKDRMARYIIQQALDNGNLAPGQTIVCASSGNTGCSFAMLGAALGYPVVVVTSSKCSEEKVKHIQAYGAEVIVTSENEYMQMADYIAEQENYFNVNQYANPHNPEAYYHSLAPEIWQQSDNKITHLVMTGSTFGCISGTARYLKQQNPEIKVILADPENSNMYQHYYDGYRQNKTLQLCNPKPYLIEGAGKSKPTPNLEFSLIDDVIQVSDAEAVGCCQHLASQHGLLVAVVAG